MREAMTDAPDAPAASGSGGPGPAAPSSWLPEADPIRTPPRPGGWRRPQPHPAEARPSPAAPDPRLAPAGLLPAMARPLVPWRELSPAERRDQHRPPGWGRGRFGGA
jgi:hypothetical protein